MRLNQGLLLAEFRTEATMFLNGFLGVDISNEELVAEFGGTYRVCIDVFQRIQCKVEEEIEPRHLLWVLYLARNYPRQRELMKKGRFSHAHFRQKRDAILHAMPTIMAEVVRIVTVFAFLFAIL